MNQKHGKVLELGPLETLFSGNATAKIIDFMISSQEWDYSESDIARNSGVSLRTVQREISKLLDSKLIQLARTIGNAKMYRLDKSHKTGYLIEKLALTLVQEDIRKMSTVELKATRKELETIPA
jgi:DNA-binding transcriptional ArsR family regulator